MIQKSGKPNRQVERTKSWVFEAIMLLMEEKPYNKITVSDITGKAGIARPTFYRNFEDKDDVIFEYLKNTFSTEILNAEKPDKDNKQDTIVLIFNFQYLLEQQKSVKTIEKILASADIENLIFREVQKFPLSFLERYKKKLTANEYLICRYKLCYQITGSLRVFFDWFINGMPMPAENVVSMLNAMNTPRSVQYRNIPNIVVRMKND